MINLMSKTNRFNNLEKMRQVNLIYILKLQIKEK